MAIAVAVPHSKWQTLAIFKYTVSQLVKEMSNCTKEHFLACSAGVGPWGNGSIAQLLSTFSRAIVQ